MLARKFVSYRLHMTGITHKTSRNALFLLWSLKAGKMLVRLDQKEEKKKKKEKMKEKLT